MRTSVPGGLAAFALLSVSLSAQDFVCSLSDRQEKEAPAAFDKLMPLFLTKRCFNCHGGINPFVAMTMGDQSKKLERRGTHPDLFDGEDKVVLDPDGTENFAKTFKACVTCHDAGAFAAGTWHLAPFQPDKQFAIGGSGIAKAPLDLCKQVKVRGRFPGAAGFIGHMKDDNGNTAAPFLETAFAGTMALDKDETDAAKDDLKNQGGYPAPITVMTPGQALQLSKDWVAAMGGKFRQPEECGCKEHHYALRVIAKGVLQMPGFTFHIGFAGQGTAFPEIPLKFQDDGSFSDSAIATPETDNEGSLPMIRCQGKRGNQVQVEVKGTWTDITPGSTAPTDEPPAPPKSPIKFSITLSQAATAATETCATPLGVMMGSSNKTGPPKFTFDFVFPDPQVNQAIAVDWPAPFPGWSGRVTAQIIEVH
jgi:hypothetical protein